MSGHKSSVELRVSLHTDPTERGDKVHRKMTFPLSSIMVFALVVMSKGQPNAQYSTYGDYSNYGGYNRNLASLDYYVGGGRPDPYAGYQASGLLAPAEAGDFGMGLFINDVITIGGGGDKPRYPQK